MHGMDGAGRSLDSEEPSVMFQAWGWWLGLASQPWTRETWENLELRPPAKWVCFGGGLVSGVSGQGLKELMLTHSLGSVGLSLSLRPINTNCGHDMWESTLSLKCGEEWLYFVEFTYIFLSVRRNKVYSLHSSANSIQHLMNAWTIYLLGLQVSRLTTIFILLLNKTTLIMPLICEN